MLLGIISEVSSYINVCQASKWVRERESWMREIFNDRWLYSRYYEQFSKLLSKLFFFPIGSKDIIQKAFKKKYFQVLWAICEYAGSERCVCVLTHKKKLSLIVIQFCLKNNAFWCCVWCSNKKKYFFSYLKKNWSFNNEKRFSPP